MVCVLKYQANLRRREVRKYSFRQLGMAIILVRFSKVKDNPRDMRDEVNNIRKDLVKGV